LSGSTWSSPSDVSAFDCVACSGVTSGPGNDAATCATGGAACAANAIPGRVQNVIL